MRCNRGFLCFLIVCALMFFSAPVFGFTDWDDTLTLLLDTATGTIVTIVMGMIIAGLFIGLALVQGSNEAGEKTKKILIAIIAMTGVTFSPHIVELFLGRGDAGQASGFLVISGVPFVSWVYFVSRQILYIAYLFMPFFVYSQVRLVRRRV